MVKTGCGMLVYQQEFNIMKVGDNVIVDTGINLYLKGVIVHKHETPPDTYNVKIYLGDFGEVIESFHKRRITVI